MADEVPAIVSSEAVQTAFERLSEIAAKYGPPAVDTAAMVVQVNGAGAVALGLFMTAASATALYLSVKVFRSVTGGYDDEGPIMLGLALGAAGMAAAIAASVHLLYIWNWVALFNPKLALAAKLVNALPGM